jgi:large subunit ribosomal protein L13
VIKTTIPKKEEVIPNWFLIDATDIRLGKLASFSSKLLQGKNKGIYTSNMNCGDYVVIINTQNISIFQKRYKTKNYWRYSGYPGGLKFQTLEEAFKKDPNFIIRKAIWGMMPKTKLGRKMIKKLFLYKDSNHKHEGQKPKLINIK